jgi:hypothetical protein
LICSYHYLQTFDVAKNSLILSRYIEMLGRKGDMGLMAIAQAVKRPADLVVRYGANL